MAKHSKWIRNYLDNFTLWTFDHLPYKTQRWIRRKLKIASPSEELIKYVNGQPSVFDNILFPTMSPGAHGFLYGDMGMGDDDEEVINE